MTAFSRAAFLLLGLLAGAAGIGLIVEGDTDEFEELSFVLIVLVGAILNLSAGALGHRRIASAATVVDLALVGFVLYTFSTVEN